MLLFIGKPDAGTVPGNHVSIHHMLLFILTRNSEKQSLQGFNTSHVTLYRFRVFLYTWHYFVSIHHMLLFIQFQNILQRHHIEVSIHHMLLFIHFGSPLIRLNRCFNTSHVTLYQKRQLQ